jgi:aminopeptidase N
MWLSNDITIKWWEDSFFFEGVNLFMTYLYFKQKTGKQSEGMAKSELSMLVFDHFKSKGIDCDRSVDSHNVFLDMYDTEEAEIFFDELTCYKSAALIKYFYYLNEEIFLQSLKQFVKISIKSSASYVDYFKIHEDMWSNKYLGYNDTPKEHLRYYLKHNNIPKLYCVNFYIYFI